MAEKRRMGKMGGNVVSGGGFPENNSEKNSMLKSKGGKHLGLGPKNDKRGFLNGTGGPFFMSQTARTVV